MTEEKTVEYEVRNRIAYITLSRPAKKNAINTQMRYELTQALVDVKEFDDLRAHAQMESQNDICGGANNVLVRLQDLGSTFRTQIENLKQGHPHY